MLLFVDESGHHESGTPYEVLAGVAIAEDNLWNLVKAVRSAEREHFGGYLRNLLSGETKGRKLLKAKRFKLANRDVQIQADDLPGLAKSLLVKGKTAREQGLADLAAYILGWGWRLNRMSRPARAELQPFASKLDDMQFQGEKPKADGSGVWQLHGITYIDDLRGQADRDAAGP